MNWYLRQKMAALKTAGVSFTPGGGAERVSRPKSLYDLEIDFYDFVRKKGFETDQFQPSLNTFANDGDFMPDALNGIMNLYVTQQNIGDSLRALDAWVSEKQTEGYQISYSNPEVWTEDNMHKADEAMAGELMGQPRVIRVSIQSNPTESYTRIPEFDIRQAYAVEIFALLGIPFEQGGSIDASELNRLISEVQQEHMQAREAPEVIEKGYWRGRIDPEVIDRQLQGIYAIADYAEREGYGVVNWH